MFPGGADPKDGQGAISSLPQNVSPDQRIQRWVDLVQQGAPVEQIHQAEMEVAQILQQQPFAIRQQLPFFQQLVKKLDATQAFQQFRLPGRDRVVVDKRDQHDQGKPAEAAKEAVKDAAKEKATKEAKEKSVKDAAGELRLHEGRLVRHKEKSYVNYLGERSDGQRHGGLDQEAASDRVERMFSAFERLVVARFEDGKKVAKESPDGKARFLAKTDGQWRDFFKGFLDRTVQKKALLADIRDFLFRGIVSKGTKGVFIGDINFASGRVEKFVRFSVLAEALAKLRALSPGDAVGRGMLEGMTGEELMYLALAVSRARDFAASMLPSQGKFMGGRAEAAAAEALGIPIDQHLRQKAKSMRGRKGGLFAGDLLGDDVPEDLPYRFIPWWQWGNLKQQGPRRWVTAVFYGSLLVMAIIGIAAVTLRLLSGV